MKNRNRGNLVEIIGTVSIVAGLVLVAWEINQANNIAKAQISCDSQGGCEDLPKGE